MPKKLLLIALILLMAGVPLGFSQGQEGLYVDAAQNLGTISPYVYGTNHGPWSAVPVDLMPYAEAAGFTFIRFPGGNWGDRNTLSEWQIDFFMQLCQKLGVETSFSVRLQNGTPEAAVEILNYTREAGYNVRYWSIGNEPNLYEDYDTEQHNRDWRAIAEALLAVDPNLILIGPEISQYPPNFAETPKDRHGRDWMTEFLKANGDLVDIVSIHRYPYPRDQQPATIEGLRQNSAEWDTIIPNLRALIRETVGHDLPVAVTEVNSHWSSAFRRDATPDSLYNAIWWADVLGRLIRQQVEIVNQWSLQSPTSYGSWGLLGNYEVRPTYYVYLLYKQFGNELLFAASSDPETTIYAARRPDGALSLMVVNLADGEKTLPLQLDNFIPSGAAEVWRLDANHLAEQLPSETLADTLTVPGQSVTVYVVGGM